MGWILFKEGNPAEAEAWIRPAMAMRENAEVAEHLGDILMAEKKGSDAAAAYAEAPAALPATDNMGVRLKTDLPRAKELRAKLEAAEAREKTARVPDGHALLQALRTWKLGAASGLKSTAEFHALLSSTGISSALPVGMVPHSMQQRIEAAKWSDRYPPGQDARLSVAVMLNCHSDVCELVLEP